MLHVLEPGSHDCRPANPADYAIYKERGYFENDHVGADEQELAQARRDWALRAAYEHAVILRDTDGGFIVLIKGPAERRRRAEAPPTGVDRRAGR
jgi:hypothetical protein